MKIKYVLFICCFIHSLSARGDQYRVFTDANGRSIEAKIVQLDPSGKKVTLERKNRKTATIPVNMLSEEDQNYILSWEKKSATTQLAAKQESVVLSKKELKLIGEQYIEALETGDFEKFRSLYLNPDQIDLSMFEKLKAVVNEMEYEGVDDGNIELSVEFNSNSAEPDFYWVYDPNINLAIYANHCERWLLLTSDGKIKYDMMLFHHPMTFAILKVYHINTICGPRKGAFVNEIHQRNAAIAYEELKSLDIPMFGLDLNSNPNTIGTSLKKIQRWMQDEGDQWDTSEPKAFYPQDCIKSESALIVN
ncbi:hypothetical protein EGM51_06185 [Verrucomicrobia bacterium S94]|nr:hypothetical protein EGM51_06185 [Verrucomicrobia bacterium S94]